MKKFLLLSLVALLSLAAVATEPVLQKKRKAGLYATLETSMGNIVIKLYEKESPITVKNFVGLATGEKKWTHPGSGEKMTNRPYYDGIIFHRVIPKFMIQTGDPLGIGRGGPGYTIPDEFNNSLKFDRPGVLGMANAGPNTGGSQFFITHVPTRHLNGKHTIFGQVVEGQKIVTRIGNVSSDRGNKPLSPVVINHVKIERVE